MLNLFTGVPLSQLEQLEQDTVRQDRNAKAIAHGVPARCAVAESKGKESIGNKMMHKPNSILFVRRRMLYARPTLNGKGEVRFGLKHIRRQLQANLYGI